MQSIRRMLAAVLVFSLTLPALAVDFPDVAYPGGTAPGLKEGTVGRIHTESETEFVFEHPGGKLSIPYKNIDSYRYEEKLAHDLGVIATLVVVVVKYRQRQHFMHIKYRDANDAKQVAIFEVSKEMARPVVAVLEARVTHGCDKKFPLQCVATKQATTTQAPE